jgi:YHS domain-containing protein
VAARSRSVRHLRVGYAVRSMRALMLLVVVSLFAGCASTKSAEGSSSAPVAAAVKKPGEATVGDTTTCPVSGEAFTIAADSPKVEHAGKTYYFCCDDCVADFQKDPAKFLAKLAAH